MNWFYIAGFLDAEGTVYFKKVLCSDNFVRRVTHLQFINTNKEVLKRIKKFLNAGHIYTHTHKNPDHFGKKPIYTLNIYKKQDLIRIVKEVVDHSFIKREKLIGLLNFLGKDINLSKFTINWSYIAGFFDGEGTIYQDGKTGYWRLSILNTNKEILEEIKSFIKSGSVYTRKKSKKSKKPIYTFQISDQRFILKFAKNTLPFSIIKKERLKEALKDINSKEWHPNYKLKGITKDELEKLYLEDKLSIRKIAKIYDVRYTSIWLQLKKFNIPRRRCGVPETVIIPKEKLVELYINKKMSATQIAKQLGVCHSTILEKLRKYGIEVRNDKKLKDIPNLKEKLVELYIKQNKTMAEIAKDFGVTKEAILRWIKKFGLKKELPIIEIKKPEKKLREMEKEEAKKLLEDLYVDKKLSLQQIASLFGITKQAVREWLKKFNIQRRRKTNLVMIKVKILKN